MATKPWYTRIWVLVALGVLAYGATYLVSFLTVLYVAQPVRFEGTSMLPTLRDNDRVMLGKAFLSLERGDVVAFNYPPDPRKSMVKRVIGLPGEQVSVRRGRVLIDGQPLDEPYVDPQLNQTPGRDADFDIPEGHVFVMGGNRDASNDSRRWGPVPSDNVYGKMLFVYWKG